MASVMFLKVVKSMFGQKPRMTRRWSIEARLSVLYTLSAFLMLLFATVFLQWVLASNLEKEDNQFLAEKLQILRTVSRDRPNDITALKQEVQWEESKTGLSQYYARVQDAAGHIVMETPDMGRQVQTLFPAFPPGADEAGTTAVWRSPKGRSYRLMAARTTNGSSGDVRLLQVALDVSSDDALIADYRRKMIAVLLMGIVFSAAAGVATARKGLRPLDEITAMAKRVTVTQLHERIGPAQWPKELAALAAAFDAMLDRLNESFTRLSRFSADLAHELRTPINNLMGEAEVALTKPRTLEEYRRVLESSLEEYAHLARMVDGLLFLARAENTQAQIERVSLDASEELETMKDFYDAASEEQGIRLVCQGTARVRADPMLLRRAISNLVSNALEHTPPGGSILLIVRQLEVGGAEVTITDTGSGIDPQHLPRLFDRFYRADPARTQKRSEHHQGTGLGLAIVKSIMEMHSGTVTLESRPGEGTSVTLKFPQ